MMDRMMLQTAMGSGQTQEEKNMSPKNAMWKKLICEIEDPTVGMSEKEQKEYERRIIQKLKAGKKLTAKELNYLRIHNPELYKIAIRVENSRRSLRHRLKTCRSKQEVQDVAQGQLGAVRSADGDPAREYLVAMVQREVCRFQKSSAYAKLPAKTAHSSKKQKKMLHVPEQDERDEADYHGRIMFLGSLQLQCEELSQITNAVMKL